MLKIAFLENRGFTIFMNSGYIYINNELVCLENVCLLQSKDDISVLFCIRVWLCTITRLLPVMDCRVGKLGPVFRHVKEVAGLPCSRRSRAVGLSH